MSESIQCWQSGTRMTLEELAANDGDCPRCDVEIALDDNLETALTENAQLRAELDALKVQRGDAACIGEVRDVGVVWFKDNPHAHALGTRFYTTPPATDALVEALERIANEPSEYTTESPALPPRP